VVARVLGLALLAIPVACDDDPAAPTLITSTSAVGALRADVRDAVRDLDYVFPDGGELLAPQFAGQSMTLRFTSGTSGSMSVGNTTVQVFFSDAPCRIRTANGASVSFNRTFTTCEFTADIAGLAEGEVANVGTRIGLQPSEGAALVAQPSGAATTGFAGQFGAKKISLTVPVPAGWVDDELVFGTVRIGGFTFTKKRAT
jgi:hypothetical protein